MDIDIKQQVKEYLLKENISMTDLVNQLNQNKPNEDNKTTIASLNNKLTRGTIKYSEILEVFDVLGYDVILQKRYDANLQSSKSASSGYITKSYKSGIAGATTGFLFGGIPGSILGGVLGASWGKSGTTTGSKDTNNKEKHIITGDDALENAKEFEIENGYNPILSDEEISEMNHQQERLDLEHDIEVNINAILDNIILNCDSSIQERYSDLIETYIEIKNYPVSFKLTSLYRVIYKFLSIQADSGLRDFISNLRNLYTHGGLLDLIDEDLKNLFEISRYYRDLLKERESLDVEPIQADNNLLSKPFYETYDFTEDYAKRFYEERFFEEDVSRFIDELIEFFIFDNLTKDSVKELFEGYKDYKYLPIDLKFKKYFQPLHFVSIRFLKDKTVTMILLKINEIYHNGIEKYSMEELDKLNMSEYIFHGFSYKENDEEQKEKA